MITLFLPLWIAKVILKNDPQDETFKAVYGAVSEGFKEKKQILLTMNSFFMIRRLLLAVVIITLD